MYAGAGILALVLDAVLAEVSGGAKLGYDRRIRNTANPSL